MANCRDFYSLWLTTVLIAACSKSSPEPAATVAEASVSPDAGGAYNVCLACSAVPDWADGCASELADCLADSKCAVWHQCAIDSDLLPAPVATFNTRNAPCLRKAGLLSNSDPAFKPYMSFGTCAGYRCACGTDYNPVTGNPAANAPDDTTGACSYDAPNGCGECACKACKEELVACLNDPLCAAVLNCQVAQKCTTVEDCFAAQKCLTQGLALGGGGAPSFTRFVRANNCSKSKCEDCVTAPKDSRNTLGVPATTDGD